MTHCLKISGFTALITAGAANMQATNFTAQFTGINVGCGGSIHVAVTKTPRGLRLTNS